MSGLSLRARGLLQLLHEQPDLPVNAALLANHVAEGKAAILSALQELRAAGHILQDRVAGADGKWRTVSIVPGRTDDRFSGVGPTTGDRLPGAGLPGVGNAGAGTPAPAEDESLVLRQSPKKQKTPSPSAPAAEDPARGILNEWWEAQDPRPGQPWIACLKVIQDLLAKGWHPDLVRRCLPRASCVSGASMDVARRSLLPQPTHRPNTTSNALRLIRNGRSL